MFYPSFKRTTLCLLLGFLVGTVSICAQGHDANRFKKKIASFEADFLENPPPEGAVLCVGSSSMQMWGGRMERDLHPLTVIPRGFGGSHFSDVLYYFDELVARYEPRAILIYEGDNDLSHGKTPQRVLEDFREFRRRVAELDASIRIYVIGVKPSLKRLNVREQIEETNRLIAMECEAGEGLTFIDVSRFLLDEEGNPRQQIFLKDGLHLNNIGYNLWGAAIGLQLIPAESPFEVE